MGSHEDACTQESQHLGKRGNVARWPQRRTHNTGAQRGRFDGLGGQLQSQDEVGENAERPMERGHATFPFSEPLREADGPQSGGACECLQRLSQWNRTMSLDGTNDWLQSAV